MISPWIYTDFTYIVRHYYIILEKREFLFDTVIPAIVFLLIGFFGPESGSEAWETFISQSLNILAILIGFSIASITILATSTSENIKEIKEYETVHKINKKKISLYQYLLINFSYTTFTSLVLCIIGLLGGLIEIGDFFNLHEPLTRIAYCISGILIFHVLLVTSRNIVNIYIILFKREKPTP